MADPAAPAKTAEVKYDYPGHEADDNAIRTVETALAAKYPDSYKEGLASSAKDAPIKEEEARGKIAKAKQDAKQEETSNPDAVKKEQQESPPPPTQVAAVKPEVHSAHGAAAGPTAAKGGAPAPAPKAPAKPSGAPGKAPAGAMPSAPQPIVMAAMESSGDGGLDGFLNGYSPKSTEPGERISKIKEMSEVAKGFDGKLENTVNVGGGLFEGAMAKGNDFLGKKEMSQLSATENPYAKVHDQLSGMMTGISRVQAFVSIVGNVCGKLGMILTILGLFGFIFPPIGAAISAVARVLNVVGLVCDLLGLALSGVLTGLNGVVLARQIGKGASNEEKAATADMMMGEANAAGGHLMNIAMAYGGQFMKGFKAASKGVLGNLMNRFKSVVGKFASKTLGPVANWAKKMGYKLGIGLEKEAGAAAPGLAKRAATKVGSWGKAAWNAPGAAIDKLKEAKWVQKVNKSGFSKGLERAAGKVDNSVFARLDGQGLEHLGKNAGQKVFTAGMEAKFEAAAQGEARAAFEASEKNAIADAGNKERAQIEKNINAQRETGNTLKAESTAGPNLNEEKAAASTAAYNTADKLEQGEDKAVAKAETRRQKEGEKEWDKKAEEQRVEKKEEKDAKRREERNVDEWKDDPAAFQAKTEKLEKDLEKVEKTANSPKAGARRKAEAAEQAEQIKKKIEQRQETSQIAGGKEMEEKPRNLKDLYTAVHEPIEEQNEEKEKEEERLKFAENSSAVWQWGFTSKKGEGGHADVEKIETDERHEKVEHWEEHKAAETSTSGTVEGMLAGVDEELGMEPADHEADHPADASGQDEPSGAPDHEEKKEAPAAAADAGATAATAAAPAPAPEPKPEEKHDEAPKDAETPELAYWPKLLSATGEQTFSSAAKELHRIRQIGFAFRKAQGEAKKKAVEAAKTYNLHGEYAKKQEEHAAEHKKATGESTNEASSSGGAAAQSGGKADQGNAEQQKGQGTAHGNAQPGPDPGDKPGLLHPIKRIWWYVKNWVSEKAAAVFGFIQEKIASMVLGVVCGISMNQLKGYTAALHHRMEYSKLVGSQGAEKAGQTVAKSMADATKAKSYEQEAIEDAAECDSNMSDADAFLKEVEESERDVAAEQAKAKVFIEQLTVAVAAEKARKEQEKQKKASEQKAQQAAAAGGSAGPVAPPPSVPKAPTVTEKAKAPAGPKPLNPAAISKVHGAAKFVADQTTLVIEQLTASKKDQRQRLKEKVSYKGKLAWVETNTRNVGDKVLDEAKSTAQEIASSMGPITGASPTTAAELHQQAGAVKEKAKSVDTFSHTANEHLNEAFKATYDALTARH